MKTRTGLKSIQTVATSREAATSREVAERMRTLEAEQHRLRQLHTYLAEYQAQLDPADGSLNIGTMRSYRGFIGRIRTAIEHQESLIARLHGQLDGHVERWKEARSQSLALKRFNERLDEEASEREARREQRRLDEVGRNQYLRTDSS